MMIFLIAKEQKMCVLQWMHCCKIKIQRRARPPCLFLNLISGYQRWSFRFASAQNVSRFVNYILKRNRIERDDFLQLNCHKAWHNQAQRMRCDIIAIQEWILRVHCKNMPNALFANIGQERLKHSSSREEHAEAIVCQRCPISRLHFSHSMKYYLSTQPKLFTLSFCSTRTASHFYNTHGIVKSSVSHKAYL